MQNIDKEPLIVPKQKSVFNFVFRCVIKIVKDKILIELGKNFKYSKFFSSIVILIN